MTDTPWTPGPWEAIEAGSKCPTEWAVTAGQEFVGDIGTEANVRLIAAAPEMAEILADIVGEYDKQDLINGEPGTDPSTMDDAARLLQRINGDSEDA